MSLFKSTKHSEFCPECQALLQIKRGKQGLFLGCSNYPACDYLKPLQQSSHIIKTLEQICPQCSALLQLKQGHFGMFIGCSNYPECEFIVQEETSSTSEITCPECQKGLLIERLGRSGKRFYGCDQYPTCRFSLFQAPIQKACAVCQYPIGVHKKQRGKWYYQCANKSCLHTCLVEE